MAKKKDFNYTVGKRYDSMMGRCYRETDPSYKNYGGKGIRVTSEWIKDINAFKDWFAGQVVYQLGLTAEEFYEQKNNFHLDRIDPTGHYTPKNCRLVSPQKNVRNRKCTKGKTITSAEGEVYEF